MFTWWNFYIDSDAYSAPKSVPWISMGIHTVVCMAQIFSIALWKKVMSLLDAEFAQKPQWVAMHGLAPFNANLLQICGRNQRVYLCALILAK